MGITSADPIVFEFGTQSSATGEALGQEATCIPGGGPSSKISGSCLTLHLRWSACPHLPAVLHLLPESLATPLLTAGVPAGITFECRLGDAAGNITDPAAHHDWRVCTSPVQYSGLPDGSYQFAVRAQVGKVCGPAGDMGGSKGREVGGRVGGPEGRRKTLGCDGRYVGQWTYCMDWGGRRLVTRLVSLRNT